MTTTTTTTRDRGDRYGPMEWAQQSITQVELDQQAQKCTNSGLVSVTFCTVHVYTAEYKELCPMGPGYGPDGMGKYTRTCCALIRMNFDQLLV